MSNVTDCDPGQTKLWHGYFKICVIIFSENGCDETYDPITDKVCARISSYAETYEDAQTKCGSEGGYLLYVLNEQAHVGGK